ncbi:DNA polymerase III subunit alpha [Lentilactobacillus farraginis]|uniref:DNA polymerase III subunit alpha n=1 Tax=Lentilactobacillus farraginis TaxID=390841 RepID=UPI000705562B|nr:DNA polymerase III subunit alpha [Lentilactobacillus farraginis]
MTYVPLQVISSYSLLQSPIRISKLVLEAKKRGYQALALTDVNVMYGTVAFYDACVAADIQPIIGLTLTLPGFILTDKSYPLVLLAKDQTGYQNLLKITTLRNTGEAEFTAEQLKGKLDSLYVILPPLAEVNDLLLRGRAPEVADLITDLTALGVTVADLKLGADYHASTALIDMLGKVAADNQIQVVADAPVDYLNPEDYFPMQVLKAIESGTKIPNITDLSRQVGPYFLQSREQVEKAYHQLDLSAALQATADIVKNCHVVIEKKQPKLPRFETPDQMPAGQYLRQLCETGLAERLATNRITDAEPYQHRLERELGVIHKMGFDDYFLIVWDVINYAHQVNIVTGPGRGSAAGSLVAYTLFITDVDPIKYNLLFERFLNPERVQMPDIDLDIPDDKRDTIIQYVHQKYGHDRVAQIITFGTLAAKQATRDVGRVFGLNPTQQDVWSKAIPSALHITLADAYRNSQQLKNLVADSELNRILFETAQVLEGLPRHYSTHAAGLVLSDNQLVNLVPLQDGNDGLLMTQYAKDYVESVGLLKIDFLGLRNLTILADALKEIETVTGKKLAVSQIPLDDAKTLALFANGETTGVFQFESAGIRSVLRRLHPTRFEDIALVNALYRPGPMENIDEVVKRKAHQEALTFPDDSLVDILKATYGVIVYQEQVMLVAAKMAGFSLGQADILRRAMSKKKLKVMDRMKSQFLAGAEKNGHSKAVAEKVFDYIEKFANYGFNKSHAVAYSKMAYELAYLKVHFPGEFHVALLNSVQNSSVKMREYLLDAKSMGVQVISPNINKSRADFSFQDQQIVFGLASIKGVRHDMVTDLLVERHQNGPYKSFPNLLSRLPDKYRKPALIEALIYAGALDDFPYNRSELIAATPEFISSIELSGNSMSLFKALEPTISRRPELPLMQRLEKEKAYLGTYLSGHPVERFVALRKRLAARPTNQLVAGMNAVYVILYITKVKVIRTKTGKQMAFLDGNDEVGEMSVTVFPQLFVKIQSWLHKDLVVVIRGKVEKNQRLQVVADVVSPAENLARKVTNVKKQPHWYLRIDPDHNKNQVFHKLTELAAEHRGPISIVVHESISEKTWILGHQFNLASGEPVKDKLITIFGQNNVVYK